MFVRRKYNKSGTWSVQVLHKKDGRNVLVKSMGASKDEQELVRLERAAVDFIDSHRGQLRISFETSTEEQLASGVQAMLDSIENVVHDGPLRILERIYDGVGFGSIKDKDLKLLSIARVCEPKSKVATVEYLRRYFDEDVHLHQIYKYMDKLYDTQRELIQKISVEHTKGILGGTIGIVFYDVTTLYFESAKEDVLRAPGFSKDGKTAETQVVLGLLVSRDGYPLSYSLFNGSQFEGRTMLPVVDDFVQRFGLEDFVVVSDAGLMSRKNIELLKTAGYKFILGGRIKKEVGAVRDWLFGLECKNGVVHERQGNPGERIIVSYSGSRADKDAYNRKRGIERLRKAYVGGKVTKKNINQRGYNKFLKVENDVAVSIDESKIAEDARWDGWKSYVTNTDFTPAEVIDRYRGLWVVERAFRVTKGTLDMRPMFHFTERRIEAHVCICFVAYKLYKELERIISTLGIGLSVDKVLDIAKTIVTITVRLPNGQKLTKTLLRTPEQTAIAPLLGITT